MNKITEIHEKIIQGLVLDDDCQWVFHSELLKKRKKFLNHVEQGQVLCNDTWVNLETALAEQEYVRTETTQPGHQAQLKPIRQQTLSPNTRTVRPTVVVLSQKTAIANPTNSMSTPGGDLIASSDDMAAVLWILDQQIPICSLKLGGYIDQSSSGQLKKAFDTLFERGLNSVIVDMGKLEYVSSAGWGIIAAELKRIEAVGGSLVLCSMTDDIDSTFRLLQFDKVLESYKTINECMSVVRQKLANKSSSRLSPAIQGNQPEIMNIRDMPVHERCKKIIAENGPMKIRELQKMLMQREYGFLKIGIIKLYLVLREMNMHTPSGQKRYYRSC